MSSVTTIPRGWDATDIPDLTGKQFLITGGTSGIGKETARELARAGAHVTITARNAAKGAATVAEIARDRVDYKLLDLADLSSVRNFAKEFTSPIDVLILNAGVMATPFSLTKDKFEMQMGTNHLGHFALTGLLQKQIKHRVVAVSSQMHRTARIGNFLPDVYVPCEVCHGARYNRETLEVHYKGKTIAQVLDMPIEEASKFFESVPAIARFLTTLCDVGLGYVRLGQSAPTLSGGEAQRVKLATELQRRSTGRTIYVLDEPTTGLHFEDVRKLLLVLNRLVDTGNTVIVIEHNLDVIKSADWVIDLGPEGGSGGGLVVAEGRPEDIVKNSKSYTGKFLAQVLKK
jgi:ABC-type branched-subunit amino acid transport system ATPase component